MDLKNPSRGLLVQAEISRAPPPLCHRLLLHLNFLFCLLLKPPTKLLKTVSFKIRPCEDPAKPPQISYTHGQKPSLGLYGRTFPR